MNAALHGLGFVPYFAQQLSVEEYADNAVARVTAVHRSGLTVSNGEIEWQLPLGGAWLRRPAEDRPTVGDWLVLDGRRAKVERVLDRRSVFRRVSAGTRPVVQLIAANVDTLFIVTSANEEFKESRLERYLVLALEAGVTPVVVLTKIDLADQADSYAARARSIRADLAVETINARDASSLERLAVWIAPASTIALVGSSGVGKSTLVNTLIGTDVAATGAIREDDASGRHTTSHRALHRLPGGGLLIDVPGMRELKVAEIDAALDEFFDDIDAIVRQCRFADCAHQTEPDCAVRAALASGRLDARRWENYTKLQREDARHSQSLAEQHARSRKFGKDVKQMLALKRELGLKR